MNPGVPETLYKSLAAEVPDVDDPNLINYWKTVDDRQIYLEGWCDKCFAGTGIGKYETQAKINYAEDLTPQVLPRKAKERGLELIEGRFVETPDKNFLVGVTVGIYRKKTENPIVFVEVRFLKDTPMITGVDMKQYGPFRKGDVAALPKENASVLIKMKVAEKRVKAPTEPTLKEVMKGEVLTGYVEAARVVRVLGEEVLLAGDDTARLADLFLDLLTDAGVSLPSRFKGEFEKAMDIYKPYDENVELIEEAAHRIILKETGKEYPVGEPLRRAREKVERLLKEIREAQGK